MFLNDKERSETIWACRFCMMCQTADRVGEIVRNESYTPRGRGAIIQSLENGLLEWNEDVADIIFTTLNDGRMQEWCVGNYDHEELIIDTRSKLHDKKLLPESIRQFLLSRKNKLTDQSALIDHLKEANTSFDDSADTLVYIGSEVSSDFVETVTNFAKILTATGVKYKILVKEPICGYAFYQAGDFEGASECSTILADTLTRIKIKNVIVLEADCYRMLTTRTKRFGGNTSDINFEHFTTTLRRLIEEKSLSVKKMNHANSVTFQDPCNLARYCRQTEDPREILTLIGAEISEMDPYGKLAFCCGGSGLLYVHKPEIAIEVARKRCQEALDTKANYLVTACIGCHKMLLKSFQKENDQKSQKLIHIIDLVSKTVEI